MRTYRFLLLCLALVLCLHSVSAVPHHAVRRQDDASPDQSQAASSASIRSSRPSTTIAPSGASSSLVSDHASSTEASVKPSGTASDVFQVPATASVAPSATSTADSELKNPLPIQPRVTPAMGLTGALLLITGLVYAVIGIKNKWIYVFGSAAYLTALAVTVLIVYLMNPPVSDGVQGAFFVAAFFTGLIFGVLSLVFSDITEGFGCLLGGFCLSMWFLSLKDGGLISSATGRAIFIGCMSAGGYSLSFSHYTRNYGLIASISFSGATVTMLGIDCLARAGWKEFWLYLWNLNDNIFPLNTNTYPLTKNIKAELAGVVIIAAFGVVSQLRVWNMVKERRQKNAAQELEKQEEKDKQEEAQGRIVEDKFQQERAQWEAAYGNKSIPESSVRTSSIASPKGSTSIREKEVYVTDSVEMVNLSKGGVASAGTSATVSVLRDDEIQQLDAQGNPITYRTLSERSLPDLPETAPTATKRGSAITPAPSVIPLPFTVPNEDDSKSEDDDNASVSAAPDTHLDAEPNHRRMSKRVSDMSASRRFSTNRASRVPSDSSEAIVDSHHTEDDQASSIAATLDDDDDNISLRQNSPPHSPLDGEHPTRPVFRQSLTTSTDPKLDEGRTNRSSFRNSRIRADTGIAGIQTDGEQGTYPHGLQDEQTGSQIGSPKDAAMPARLSKVALSYRTNEWAKHLETAEKPDLDDLRAPVSPGAILEEVPEERAVPVSDEIAGALMGSKRTSKRASMDKANRLSGFGLDRSASTLSQESLADQRMKSGAPSASSGILSRSNSGAQLDALVPLPSNTLLGQRETLMRKRTSSQSITPGSSAANLLELADQESMSLAQRKQILQSHQSSAPMLQHQTSFNSPRRSPPSTSQKWQNKTWAAKGAPAGFNSHQPKRTSSSQSDRKREELYAGWRDNIRDVTPPQTQAYMVEQQRASLLTERRQKEMEKQQREAIQQQRASQIDSVMRSGHMLDAHREAMRKMQAKTRAAP